MAWDGEYLDTARPVLLDIGAAGKGYLVDLVSDLLVGLGIGTHVVDASGDLRVRGDASERIALEHPADPTKAIGVVELREGALCASASNRRSWGDGLHHVIDAVTGVPTADVIATWALAPDALHADGLATAAVLRSRSEPFAERRRVLRQNVRQRARADVAVLPWRGFRMTAWLDGILGRVTMYALVIISLGIIGVAALVYSLLGVLGFTPLALLASAAVLLVASYIANGLFGSSSAPGRSSARW